MGRRFEIALVDYPAGYQHLTLIFRGCNEEVLLYKFYKFFIPGSKAFIP